MEVSDATKESGNAGGADETAAAAACRQHEPGW